MAALLEENVMTGDTNSLHLETPSEPNTNAADSFNRTMSMLKNGNGISIERRVKKELIEQGLMDADDLNTDDEDEILSEIKRVRTELSAISEYNYKELQNLHTAAKGEMKRLEIKRQLDSVDQEVPFIFAYIFFLNNRNFVISFFRSLKCTKK